MTWRAPASVQHPGGRSGVVQLTRSGSILFRIASYWGVIASLVVCPAHPAGDMCTLFSTYSLDTCMVDDSEVNLKFNEAVLPRNGPCGCRKGTTSTSST